MLECHKLVPTLIVNGQSDDLIHGNDVIKYLICELKVSGDVWKNASLSDAAVDNDVALHQLLATVENWK